MAVQGKKRKAGPVLEGIMLHKGAALGRVPRCQSRSR